MESERPAWRELRERVRWGNAALAALALGAVGLALAWPRSAPVVPGGRVVRPAPSPPRAPVVEPAPRAVSSAPRRGGRRRRAAPRRGRAGAHAPAGPRSAARPAAPGPPTAPAPPPPRPAPAPAPGGEFLPG